MALSRTEFENHNSLDPLAAVLTDQMNPMDTDANLHGWALPSVASFTVGSASHLQYQLAPSSFLFTRTQWCLNMLHRPRYTNLTTFTGFNRLGQHFHETKLWIIKRRSEAFYYYSLKNNVCWTPKSYYLIKYEETENYKILSWQCLHSNGIDTHISIHVRVCADACACAHTHTHTSTHTHYTRQCKCQVNLTNHKSQIRERERWLWMGRPRKAVCRRQNTEYQRKQHRPVCRRKGKEWQKLEKHHEQNLKAGQHHWNWEFRKEIT